MHENLVPRWLQPSLVAAANPKPKPSSCNPWTCLGVFFNSGCWVILFSGQNPMQTQRLPYVMICYAYVIYIYINYIYIFMFIAYFFFSIICVFRHFRCHVSFWKVPLLPHRTNLRTPRRSFNWLPKAICSRRWRKWSVPWLSMDPRI